MISVLVVDDHPIFRLGLVQALALEPDIQIVAEAVDGEQALEMIARFLPNVAVMDINLPRCNGQWVTYQVRRQNLPTRVLLLTGYDDLEQTIHSASNGAAGYSSKDIEPRILVKYVRWIADGGYVFLGRLMSAEEAARWVQEQIEKARLQYYQDPGQPYTPLTERELQVMRLLVCGASNKEIAATLKISQQTVKNHITAILRKMGVSDRTQAVSRALYLGWVKLNDLRNVSQ
ncbi:MAG: response regulator transcription factor [Anaerolineales bacterium]